MTTTPTLYVLGYDGDIGPFRYARPATHDDLIAAMPRCGTCGYCDDEHHISSFDGSDDATTILFCSLDERETWASHSCTEHKERV